ncbi:MAG: LytTR family DNA-binding domain-containing protein [Cellulophaga sp.]
MKIVIVEDETPAAEKLTRYLFKFDANIEIAATLSSISEAVHWFQNEVNTFDVIFMDIQLTDGLSFEIFNQIQINKPVIFTTAFDEYAIDAFKVNSIDYILKPITFTDLSTALNKLKRVQTAFSTNTTIAKIANTLPHKKTKDRFLVRLGNHIHSIKTEEISLFYAEGRTVFLITNQSKKFILDYTLEDLFSLLKNQDFFRVNRSFIININAIKDVVVFSNSRLKVVLKTNTDKEIIVSREKVSAFKKWLEGM